MKHLRLRFAQMTLHDIVVVAHLLLNVGVIDDIVVVVLLLLNVDALVIIFSLVLEKGLFVMKGAVADEMTQVKFAAMKSFLAASLVSFTTYFGVDGVESLLDGSSILWISLMRC